MRTITSIIYLLIPDVTFRFKAFVVKFKATQYS
jgi:hypothetical protein